ncbi:unnamed protein product [Alopecurus aequalis]
MFYRESMAGELIHVNGISTRITHSNHNVKRFTTQEIVGITDNYKTILDRGAFGHVYEGVLEDQSIVAVMRFIHSIEENFAKELTVHCEINQKNVVRLIGYCIDEKALTMVTEYIPEGNLSDVLHRNDVPFPLDTRLRIAIECAEALSYMHSHMCIQVIHGDIQPANILLDEKFGAKISDFALSRLVNTDNTLYTPNLVESIGYMDPLFAQNGVLGAKSDVYSFGVVLLELITREKARTDHAVVIFTQDLARGVNRVRKMFDAEIATPCDMKIIEEIATLSGRCLSMELHRRPEMLEVAECLQKLRESLHRIQEKPRILSLFSWGWKRNTERTETSAGDFRQVEESSQEKINSSQNMRIVGPAEILPSQENSSTGQNWRNVTLAEAVLLQERMSCQKLRIFSSGSAETTLQLEVKDLFSAEAEVLGKGAVGKTYRVEPLSGPMLAVKRLKYVNLPKNEFKRRVSAISAIQNEHIAPLRGYYFSRDEKLLLYDHMPMGSVAAALHGEQGSSTRLDWKQRLAISLAVARGVASIHSVRPSSSHGNIKSSNILLTGTHEACVSEHGLKTLVGWFPKGSGYHAPELADSLLASQEADVYSFGILLLEMLTGKAPGDSTKPEYVDLRGWVWTRVNLADHRCMEFDVDLRQQQKAGAQKGMSQLLWLAMDCSVPNAKFRPMMSDVVRRIENIQQSDPGPCTRYITEPVLSQESGSSKKLEICSSGSAGTTSLQLELVDLLSGKGEILGKSAVGTTYMAEPLSGPKLAVKRLKCVYMTKNEFEKCVSAISAIRNEHIVPLLGYFFADDEKLLLYDYMPMGSLAKALHGKQGSSPRLDWGQRLAISLSAARGVAYIHSAGPSSSHGNIKSSNILLTGTHQACVSDHSLEALFGQSPKGSGYRAPEVGADFRSVSQEADVYSFGILLLEMLTGKDPGDITKRGYVDFRLWVWMVDWEDHRLMEFDVDLRQQQKPGARKGMLQLLWLAVHCLVLNPKFRPTMSDVVRRIEKIQQS